MNQLIEVHDILIIQNVIIENGKRKFEDAESRANINAWVGLT